MSHAPVRMESLDAEVYRSLRTTLSYSHLPEGKRVVLVTSARRGEGKSTTAANLATTCAHGDRPTLLIDADLRNPQVERIFGLARTAGLVSLLQGDGTTALDDVALATALPTLDILPAGGPAATAPELLSRPRLAEVIDAARSAYDWVVVDAPPVLPVADAVIVSRHVDGVVLVVDVSRTPIETARRARDLLRAVDAPLLGLVANRSHTKLTASAYGRYPG